MRQYRAPTANRAVLAEPNFDSIPALVEANRKRLDRDDVVIGGLPLRGLRALARREVLELACEHTDSPARRAGLSSCAGPLLLAGHQPELSHPGVWVKNFALNGLAKKLGGVPLNLVVDNDTLKSTSLRLPVFREGDPASVQLRSEAFDSFSGEVPYEDRMVIDVERFRLFGRGIVMSADPTAWEKGNGPESFRFFAHGASPMWVNWGYEPLLAKDWAITKSIRGVVTEIGPRQDVVEGDKDIQMLGVWTSRLVRERSDGVQEQHYRLRRNVGECFTAMRRKRELEWGCDNLELPVSELSQTDAFARFAQHILGDLPRFRQVYNAALRAYREANGIRSANHPAPELAEGEAPFWVRAATGRRERATPASDVRTLRSRALTLTLFARVCLGDLFIHGIGGGKYDEVTDAIIRDYFGIEPPAYQVLSATLHLPLPGFPSTPDDLHRAERRMRDLHWNPQRHLTPEQRANPEVKVLLDAHATLAASEPPYAEHAARREWFRSLKEVSERLRPLVADSVPVAEAELARVRSEVDANAILRRRDYAWVLYPEEMLREFLTQFLQ
jgi:hypothetical protein